MWNLEGYWYLYLLIVCWWNRMKFFTFVVSCTYLKMLKACIISIISWILALVEVNSKFGGKKAALHAPGDWESCQQSWPKWKSCYHYGILLFSHCLIHSHLVSFLPYSITGHMRGNIFLSNNNMPKYVVHNLLCIKTTSWLSHFSYRTHLRWDGKLGKWSTGMRCGYIFVSGSSYYSLEHCHISWKNSTDPLWNQQTSIWLSAGLNLTEKLLVISHYSWVPFV